MKAVLNIHSKSDDWRAQRLSNFSPDPFLLDGEELASVEGFIQGIKFPEDNPTRRMAFQSIGIKAKRLGADVKPEFVRWNGRAIPYGSPEHRQLIERAIRTKYAQNYKAMEALLATEGMTLTHETGNPDSISIPKAVFCNILTRIREEEIQKRK